jgi:hypothetical protein
LNSAMRHRRPGHTNSPSRSYRDPGRERRNPNQTASNIGVRRCGCPSPAESGYRDAHGMGWEDGAHLSLQPASQHRSRDRASAVEVSASQQRLERPQFWCMVCILGCPNQPSPGSPGGWLGQGAKAGAGGDVPPPVSILSTAPQVSRDALGWCERYPVSLRPDPNSNPNANPHLALESCRVSATRRTRRPGQRCGRA